MAQAKKVTRTIVDSVEISLSVEEAGYLRELLSVHVGGPLLATGAPLGRVRGALVSADVDRQEIRRRGLPPLLDRAAKAHRFPLGMGDMLSSLIYE